MQCGAIRRYRTRKEKVAARERVAVAFFRYKKRKDLAGKMELRDSIGTVKGIGEKTEKLFARLAIFTVEELLEHYPRNYESYGEIVPAAQVKAGEASVVEVSLVAAPLVKKIRGLTILSCRVQR